jgi:hypothetical protein
MDTAMSFNSTKINGTSMDHEIKEGVNYEAEKNVYTQCDAFDFSSLAEYGSGTL